MADVYSVVLLIMELAVVFCCFQVKKTKKEYSKPLVHLFFAGMCTVFFYILFLRSFNMEWGTFFTGLYYVGTDWVLLFMMRFILVYTNTRLHSWFLRALSVFWVTVDTVSLMLNNLTHHMFFLESAEYKGIPYWGVFFNPFHYIHLAGCYIMALFTIIVLVHKIIRSPKLYKRMYASVLVVFGAVLIINAVCYSLILPIDASVVCYVLLAVAFCYFLIYASPKGLVEGILANVVEDIDNGIVCFDFTGKCIYANAKAKNLLSVPDDKVSEIKDEFYTERSGDHESDFVDYESWDKEYRVGEEDHHFHIEFQRLKGSGNATIGFFYKLTDMTAAMKGFQESQYMATHDRLTGLYTRDYFFQKAGEIIKRDPEAERYMVCANIKNFRVLNDLFGEEMSDKILVAQAALLKYTNIEECIQGRISGEKFAMLIDKENFNAEMTVKNLGRLQYMIDGRNYKLNIAVGVYRITDPEENPEEMFEKASMAVESQVGDYQKTVVYYDSQLLQQVMKEKNIAEEFENALKTRQFKMFLQPQTDVDGNVVGAEALARWQHPQRGLILPADFLSVVEKTRLISMLDEYMWELAAEKLREWQEQGYTDAHISVNISAKDFYYIDIYETLVQIVKKYGVDPSGMNLEISETELLMDAEPQIKELNRLQDFGFSIQIDDFGKGYSSLNMLQTIHANVLKVDMSLLSEIPDPVKMKKILNAIFTMARALDMELIMESVETKEQVDLLTELDCGVFQGYFFSRPIPVEEFEEKYLKSIK